VSRRRGEGVVRVVSALSHCEDAEYEDVSAVVVATVRPRSPSVAGRFDAPGHMMREEEPHQHAPDQAGQQAWFRLGRRCRSGIVTLRSPGHHLRGTARSGRARPPRAFLGVEVESARDRLSHGQRTRSLLNAHVRDCLVTGYATLIASLTLPDPDDSRVLAAPINHEPTPSSRICSQPDDAVSVPVALMRCCNSANTVVWNEPRWLNPRIYGGKSNPRIIERTPQSSSSDE
jgi:hypothetical protein